MPAKKKERISAKECLMEILNAAEGPMKVTDLAQQVVDDPRVELRGLTPLATVNAITYTLAKAGKITKVDRGLVEAIREAPAKPKRSRAKKAA